MCPATRYARHCRRSESEGFVELEPRRGARVAVISVERANELFELREALEGMVARLAAQRRTPDQLLGLQRLVQLGADAAALRRSRGVARAEHRVPPTALRCGEQLDAGRHCRADVATHPVGVHEARSRNAAASRGRSTAGSWMPSPTAILDVLSTRRVNTSRMPPRTAIVTGRWTVEYWQPRCIGAMTHDVIELTNRADGQKPRTAPPSTAHDRAGDEAGAGAGQEDDDVGQFLGATEPTHGDRRRRVADGSRRSDTDSASARAFSKRPSAGVSNCPVTITLTVARGASSNASDRAAAATPLRNTELRARSGRRLDDGSSGEVDHPTVVHRQ